LQAVTEENRDSDPSELDFPAIYTGSLRTKEEETRDVLSKERIESYLNDDSDSKFAQSLAAAAAAAATPFSRQGRSLLSEEEWELLKPVIQRWYIEEKNNFSDVVDILSRLHNIRPE
jgi:hypothetical protein